ncbi:MAG: DUF6088 family protein [Bacteroidota bacterium]
MKVSDYIKLKIERLPKSYVFTYEDFITEVNTKEAIIKYLNRMAASGKIAKISKGKFYKPKDTVFGKLQPDQFQLVKDLLEDENKLMGYLTGYSIYNSLGLTSQISNTIQIGKNEIRPTFKRERFTISFIKQKNTITKDNIPFLQLLDAMRYIKKIPDCPISKAITQFLDLIKKYEDSDVSNLVRLAQKYPPATRALLGAILDELGKSSLTDSLLKSLNPITQYTLKGANKVLAECKKWNIV